MARIINPNLRFLTSSYKKKRGVILSGSSRSGKTFSSLDFIVYISSKIETGCTINIIKETYNSFKTTLYDDFNRRLPEYGIASPFAQKQEVKQFKLFGNKINLLGADDPAKFHGASCDYAYFNEFLDIPQSVFDQVEMRCRKFWWGDLNPKYADHWLFNKVQPRDDVGFLQTTFRDNPHVSAQEKAKILSYEPTPDNIRQGTADEYMWNVYGLGLRSAPEGLVFQHVTWIDSFPKDIETIYYGMDFGTSQSPTTINKVGVSGNNLYVQCLFYKPTPSSNELIPAVREHCGDGEVWADSAMPGFISDCRNIGKLKVYAVSKFPGSIKYGISVLKRYKIHIVDTPSWRKEQGGYKYKVINGIQLDEPEDDMNHNWDALRYVAISRLRHGFVA